MLTKAGKFKFNAETAFHSPSVCVDAGGGEESLQNSPAMVSTLQTARGGKPGAPFASKPWFWNFLDLRVEVQLRCVPLFKGCEKGDNVHTVREQSSTREIKCVLKDFI